MSSSGHRHNKVLICERPNQESWRTGATGAAEHLVKIAVIGCNMCDHVFIAVVVGFIFLTFLLDLHPFCI